MGVSERIETGRRLNPEVPLPQGFSLDALVVGTVGQEALVVSTSKTPGAAELRRIHKDRLNRRSVTLAVAATGDQGTWLLGPSSDGLPVGPLGENQAARILEAVLSESNALAARQRLASLLAAAEPDGGLVGVSNSGLFATHYLEQVPEDRGDWAEFSEKAVPLVGLRGLDLINGLGYRSEGLGSGALLLSVADDPPQSVAVLVDESEGFDAVSTRFGVSPIQHGLAKATQARVPWLMVLRGSQVRLYPLRPEVGVGRRSQAETFFELDLAVVDEHSSGFLAFVFSAGALADGGTVDDLLTGSTRYAAALGESLRDRVYEQVVPALAVAVAGELERLGRGDDLDSAYRITLKILFRLLFQAYAEDQGLLPYGRNQMYTRNSLTTLANDFVARPDMDFDAESHSIWDGLQQVWDVIDTGDSAWDVPAYNGGLFSSDPDLHPDGALIEDMRLPNLAVGTALKHLLCDTTDDGGLGVVDFRSLSVREFGTIYEGLLESSLSRAEQDLTVDAKGAYIPAGNNDLIVVPAGEVYHHNSSGERKSTGSYFTKSFAVEHLLERALDPALDRHLEAVATSLDAGDEAGAAERFFDFRVADLAMGSGHFLIAAVDRIEAKMATFLVEHPIARITEELNRLEQAAREALGSSSGDHAIEASALLRRQIAKRCLYGLDINEIAVELARVGLWIHTFVPGLPMSSLDHTLVCANSLTGVGTIEEALDALEPQRATGQFSMYADAVDEALAGARGLLSDVAASSEATKAEVRQAFQAYQAAREAAAGATRIFDAAIGLRSGLATDLVDSIDQPGSGSDPRLEHLKPGHFPALFPEVFNRTDPGFDVLVGNPPWETLHLEEDVWWATHAPGIRGMAQQRRRTTLNALREARPDLVETYERERETVDRMRAVISAGPYRGIGAGHIDLYQAFAWRNWQLLRARGRLAFVLPRNALVGSGTLEWRRAVLDGGSFADVMFLTNTGGWVFDEIHQQYTVALVVVEKGTSAPVGFAGPFHSAEEFVASRSDLVIVPRNEFVGWSDSLSFPRLTDTRSGEILRKMRRHPRFDSSEEFEFRPVQGDINATTDRQRFETDLGRDDLDLAVLTGSSFNLWEPEFGEIYGRGDRAELEPHLLAKAQAGARSRSSAFSGLAIDHIEDHPISRARIAYRSITNSTNRRTGIFCLVPPQVALVHSAPYLLRRAGTECDEAYVLGIASSILFDWYIRRWVEMNLLFYILNAVPVPRPHQTSALRSRIVELSGQMAAVSDRYQEWADAVGVAVGGLSGEAKDDAIAELDALAALLYGLPWEDVEHIFATFHRGWDPSDRLGRVKRFYEQWEGQA